MVIANDAQRPVTIERAGLSMAKEPGESFEWSMVYHGQSSHGSSIWRSPLPKTLAPGEPAYREVRAALYVIRNQFPDDPPRWAWCVDTYRTVYWEPLPDVVRRAVRATKRRVAGEQDEMGHPTTVEVDD